MEPRFLTVQTATPGGSIALTAGNQLLGEFCLNTPRPAGDWLLEATNNLLGNAGLKLSELDGLGVVAGPGAFTGLRVGIATVKGLALAMDKPVVAVSSLECLALQAPFCGMQVCAMLDARKKEVYAALYTHQGAEVRSLVDEMVLAPELFVENCPDETLFVGSGATVYRTLLTRQLGPRAHFLSGLYDMPRAALAAQLVYRDWQAGKALSAERIQPRYIRPSEAELNMPK